MGQWATESNTARYQRNRRTRLVQIWDAIHLYFSEKPYRPGLHPSSLYGGNTDLERPPDMPTLPPGIATRTRQQPEIPAPLRAPRRVRYIQGNTTWETELADYYVAQPIKLGTTLHTHWSTARSHREGANTTLKECNFQYHPEDFEIITNKAMYNSHVDHMTPCKHCWTQLTVPEGWNLPAALPDSDDEDTDLSKSDSSDDEPDTDEELHIQPHPHQFGDDPNEDIPDGDDTDDSMRIDG